MWNFHLHSFFFFLVKEFLWKYQLMSDLSPCYVIELEKNRLRARRTGWKDVRDWCNFLSEYATSTRKKIVDCHSRIDALTCEFSLPRNITEQRFLEKLSFLSEVSKLTRHLKTRVYPRRWFSRNEIYLPQTRWDMRRSAVNRQTERHARMYWLDAKK